MRNVGKQAAAGKSAWANVIKLAAWGAIGGGAVFLTAGCEKMESTGRAGDRAVDIAVNDSIGSNDPAKAASAVKASLGSASPAGKARGNSELARDEFDQAIALLPRINQEAQDAETALFDLRQAASEVLDIQQTAAGYNGHDPKETLAKLDEERANMQKAVEQAQNNAASLKAELQKRQQEIDALKAERQKADNEAESLAEKSNNAKGQESLDLFKQATEARTKSGTLAAQIETRTAALMPIQRQLAIAEATQKLYDNPSKDAPGAIARLDRRKAEILAEWQGNQQHAQSIADSAKKLADAVITPGGEAKNPNAGARLATAMQALEKDRSQAEKLLQSAAQHADDAYKAADSLHKELARRVSEAKPQSPDIPALDAVIAAFNEKQYALQKGNIQTALGNLYADQYTLESHAKQTLDEVAQALQATGQSVPSGMAAPSPDAAKASAEKAYAAAEQSLESVVNATGGGNIAGSKDLKSNALASLLMARYGHYELTLDDATHARLKEDIARAKEAAITVPPSLRDIK